MPLYEANGDSRVYYTVNLKKKKVRVDLVLYSTSLTFHDQSYSLVHGFNIPISFRNTEVQHCFSHPCYKLIKCFSDNILFDDLLTKCFGN